MTRTLQNGSPVEGATAITDAMIAPLDGQQQMHSVATSRSCSPKRNRRHNKGLSLNFPILLPSNIASPSSSPRSASPTRTSARAMLHLKADSSPSLGQPASPKSRTSPDFLTLVAGQERRVLELREELLKAETELGTLKKQWAVFEANKKRDEVRQNRKMAVPLDQVPSPTSKNGDEVEEERRRRRALVEMNNVHSHAATTGPGRKGTQRVFEGGHTRTLSLLSPASQKANQGAQPSSIDQLMRTANEVPENNEISRQSPGKVSPPRTTTFEDLMSPEGLQAGFGTTYKELAAHRKSLPPGVAADMFMKQSKQMVDGVKEGLWTFWEDMRQATIGDEAMASNDPRASKQVKSHPARSRSKISKTSSSTQGQQKEESFWREFGVDTPQKSVAKAHREPLANGHISQKTSTDSQKPPDLLKDSGDHEYANGVDDWDDWESPISTKHHVRSKGMPVDGDGLPWPELQKDTPSKLTRTVSDLMRDWQNDPSRERPAA